MSALDSGQAALKIVWVSNVVGSNFSFGDDGSGVGTPSNPYLSIPEAAEQIAVFTGSDIIEADWKIRTLGGGASYGPIIISATGAAVHISSNFNIDFQGWKDSWNLTRGKWLNQNEKPVVEYFKGDTGNSNKSQNYITSDFNFDPITNIKFFNMAIGESGVAQALFYGCRFRGVGTENGRGSITSNNDYTFVSCIFDNIQSHHQTANAETTWINCIFYADDSFIGQAQILWNNQSNGKKVVQSCIFYNNNTGGLYCYENLGTTDQRSSTVLLCHRNLNRYFINPLANWAKFYSTGPIFSTFDPAGVMDAYSSSGDPLMEDPSNGDFRLKVISPVLDKGGLPGSDTALVIDPNAEGRHKLDALGELFGDSVDANTIETETSHNYATLKFSHRTCGAFQNSLTQVPPVGLISWPVGVIPVITDYLVAKVQDDPDDTGTVQPRFLQADNDAMDSGLIIVDACPLNVTSSNNKIDFKEDGGGELTATLTVGIFNTIELMAEIKTQLESSGIGTYSVNYDSGTEQVTISVSGSATTAQFLFGTGTNNANSARVFLGFELVDTSDQASNVSQDKVIENFYDSNFTYEYSADYADGEDPESSGSWSALGTGVASDSGIEGTNGVLATAATDRYVRTNMGITHTLGNNKYHSVQYWSGTLESQDDVF